MTTIPDPRDLGVASIQIFGSDGHAKFKSLRSRANSNLEIWPRGHVKPKWLGSGDHGMDLCLGLAPKNKKIIFVYMGIFVLPHKFFFVIFYNNRGHSCLLMSGNNVRPTLHAWPKAIELGVFARLKSIGSDVVVKPKTLGFGVFVLKKKIILIKK